MLYVYFNTTGYSNRMVIDGPGEKEYYNDLTRNPVTDVHEGTAFYGGSEPGVVQYELNKW